MTGPMMPLMNMQLLLAPTPQGAISCYFTCHAKVLLKGLGGCPKGSEWVQSTANLPLGNSVVAFLSLLVS